MLLQIKLPAGFFKATRAAAIAWCAVLIALINFGPFSGEKPGAVTWGPTSDIWAMSIAISNLQYGLEGQLGYREVEKALVDIMTTKKSAIDVNDEETRDLVGNPAVVTRAIRAATNLDPKTFTAARADDGGFVVMSAEDVGFADYYKWAFKLFSFDAYSTRYLYVSILTLSFVLFISAFATRNMPIALVTLALSALFAETTSGIFNWLLPSISANRFLSTLAIIPFFHIVCGVLDFKKLTRPHVLLALAQSLLLAFAVSARSSANWTLIAFFLIVVLVTIFRAEPATWSRLLNGKGAFNFGRTLFVINLTSKHFVSVRTSPGMPSVWRGLARPAILLAAIVFGSVGTVATHNTLKLDKIYFGDDVLGHHLIWHNAYIALALHPDWPKLKPYAEQPDALSDATSWIAYEKEMQKRGMEAASAVGIMHMRILDRIIQHDFIRFAMHHPRYMLELFLVHKTKRFISILEQLIITIPKIAWVVSAVGIFIAGILLSGVLSAKHAALFYCAIFITWTCSLLPSYWAYASTQVFADQLWSCLFVFLFIVANVFSYFVRTKGILPAATDPTDDN